MKNLLIITMLLGFGYSQSASLEIQNVNLTEGTLDIYMTNDVPVAGFQFYLSGMTITSVYAGSAYDYFDWVDFHAPTGKVMGADLFSMNVIPPGEEILIMISFTDFEDETICFVDTSLCSNGTEVGDCEDIGGVPIENILSDNNVPVANEIPSTWGDCYENDNNWVYGCTYETATNYNPDATFDDGSCEFLWGDMNHDGTLNVQDIIFLVNAILSGDWF